MDNITDTVKSWREGNWKVPYVVLLYPSDRFTAYAIFLTRGALKTRQALSFTVPMVLPLLLAIALLLMGLDTRREELAGRSFMQ